MPAKRKPKKKQKFDIVVAGKRKRAVAKARVREGDGSITINSKPITLLPRMRALLLQEPLHIAEKVIPGILSKVNITITATGGGIEAQTEASRLAIARALVAYTKKKELRDAFAAYDRHLLTADVRRKETRKPGDSRARAKRQKSYR